MNRSPMTPTHVHHTASEPATPDSDVNVDTPASLAREQCQSEVPPFRTPLDGTFDHMMASPCESLRLLLESDEDWCVG